MTDKKKSQVIYKGRIYTACEMSDGALVVTRNDRQQGVRLVGDNAPHWIECIKNAVDNEERSFICRAVFGK